MEENPSVKLIGSAAPAGGQRSFIPAEFSCCVRPGSVSAEFASTHYTFCAMRFWEIRQDKNEMCFCAMMGKSNTKTSAIVRDGILKSGIMVYWAMSSTGQVASDHSLSLIEFVILRPAFGRRTSRNASN